jgi:hypothetical protein
MIHGSTAVVRIGTCVVMTKLDEIKDFKTYCDDGFTIRDGGINFTKRSYKISSCSTSGRHYGKRKVQLKMKY